MIFFHTTPSENVPSILREGLRRDCARCEQGVFLSTQVWPEITGSVLRVEIPDEMVVWPSPAAARQMAPSTFNGWVLRLDTDVPAEWIRPCALVA